MNIIDYINSDEIKNISNEIANADFINEMSSGNLIDERFRYYLIQDDIYLKYYKIAGSNIKKITKDDEIKDLYDLIGYDEPLFHSDMLKKFNVKKENINENMINYTTYSYINHLLRWSSDNDINGMYSMFACQWSYEFIAKTIKNVKNKYKFWFDFYKSNKYTDITELYFKILNKLDINNNQKNIFKFGLLYELNYWIDSYNKYSNINI